MPSELPREVRTPEQHDAVRRRSNPLGLCGALVGLAALAALIAKPVDAQHPPGIFAVNLSFCALMMGIGIFFYARGTPGTRLAAIASLLAIITGLAGTFLYARQATQWRAKAQDSELVNVAAIADGALHFAQHHAGEYPPDLTAMLLSKDITLDNLHSPADPERPRDFYQIDVNLRTLDTYALLESQCPVSLSAFRTVILDRLQDEVKKFSDYQYLGNGLHLPAKPDEKLPEEILLATSFDTVLGKQVMSVSYADGRADFLEQSAAESAFNANNDARQALGFSTIRRPHVLENAAEEKSRKYAAPAR